MLNILLYNELNKLHNTINELFLLQISYLSTIHLDILKYSSYNPNILLKIVERMDISGTE